MRAIEAVHYPHAQIKFAGNQSLGSRFGVPKGWMVDRELLIKELTRKFWNRARRSHAKREESRRSAVNKSAEENSGMANEAVNPDGEARGRNDGIETA